MTAAEWGALPPDYRRVIDGVRYGLTRDRETGGTVLEPVDEDIAGDRQRKGPRIAQAPSHENDASADTQAIVLPIAPPDVRLLVDQLGNALQAAVLLAEHLERATSASSQDARAMTRNLTRATETLRVLLERTSH